MIWNTDVVCPTCKASTAVRVNRNGFLQRRILSRFGFYPWKCGECGCTFLFRKRGREEHGRRRKPHRT